MHVLVCVSYLYRDNHLAYKTYSISRRLNGRVLVLRGKSIRIGTKTIPWRWCELKISGYMSKTSSVFNTCYDFKFLSEQRLHLFLFFYQIRQPQLASMVVQMYLVSEILILIEVNNKIIIKKSINDQVQTGIGKLPIHLPVSILISNLLYYWIY